MYTVILLLLVPFPLAQWKLSVDAMNLEDIVHPGYKHPSQEDNVTAKDGASSGLSAAWIKELLDPIDGSLAGENTPVWTAHRDKLSTRVRYTKLEKDGVKMAIEYWKSPEFKGLAVRARRDIREKVKEILSSVIERVSRPKQHNINDSGIESVAEESSDYSMEVIHPSVLIIMDYVKEWPADKMDEEKLINERILYALAFWKGVDLQFRHVRKPEIRLRISEIIIAENKEATPYVYDHQKARGLDMDEAYRPMMRYWRQLAVDNKDFPLEGYHIVATMTNSTPTGLLPVYTHAIASTGPPCFGYGTNIGGLIFPDNLAFEGLQVAVHETAHTLGANHHDGDSEDCPAKKGSVMAEDTSLVGRNWSECTLKRISERIRLQGSCLESPREFRPPGKPIEPILPGELTPASKQCEDRGWEDGIVCWDRITCGKLFCRNNHWWSWCGDSGAPVDGTACKTGKICLDGKCVSPPQANAESELQKSPRQSTPELQDLNGYGDPLSVLPIRLQAHRISRLIFKNNTRPS